jgi:hypothetical protein
MRLTSSHIYSSGPLPVVLSVKRSGFMSEYEDGENGSGHDVFASRNCTFASWKSHLCLIERSHPAITTPLMQVKGKQIKKKS